MNYAYNKDCFEVLPTLKDGSVDMVLADLPYGVLDHPWDVPLPLDRLWQEYNRIVKPDGVVLLFGQGTFSAKVMLSNEEGHRYNLVWDKKIPAGHKLAGTRPMNQHEDILVFYKDTPTYNKQMTVGKPYKVKADNGKGMKTVTLRNPTSILTFPRSMVRNHPAEKPVELFEWLIRTYTKPGELVLDNTAGVLTTAKAAQNSGRRWICIEREKEFFDIDLAEVSRWRQTMKIEDDFLAKGTLGHTRVW